MPISNKAQTSSKITAETGEVVEVTNTSNTLVTNKIDSDILVEKTSEKSWSLPKGKVKVTTTITNNTDQNLENIRVSDTLSNGAVFVTGSVKIGSQTYDEFNPITGFTLPVTLGGSGADMFFEYEIELLEYLDEDVIKNNTTIAVNFDSKSFNITSNDLEIKVLHNDVSLLKYADTTAVKSRDELTYTIEISNSGTLTNTEVFFSDTIPEGTSFVENSVTVDTETKQGFNPNSGFLLGTLLPNQIIMVKFKVKID